MASVSKAVIFNNNKKKELFIKLQIIFSQNILFSEPSKIDLLRINIIISKLITANNIRSNIIVNT